MAAAAAPGASLVDGAALRQLETLSLTAVEAIVAGFGGQHTGAQRTRGLEFVDYRRYTPGDDLRSIDWNVYARLREIVVKASPAEGHVDLALLLDGSRSMDDGAPSRFRYAQELGAMLGTVALLGSDVVAVHMLADGGSYTGARLAAPHLVTELIEDVGALPRGTRTDLAASLRDVRRSAEPADLAVLLSDGLAEPAALAEALGELAATARSTAFVHLVASDGAVAALDGAFELGTARPASGWWSRSPRASAPPTKSGCGRPRRRCATAAPTTASPTSAPPPTSPRSTCCSAPPATPSSSASRGSPASQGVTQGRTSPPSPPPPVAEGGVGERE